MKADEKVEYEDDNGKMAKEKYSNFEMLDKKVEQLQEMIEEISHILRANNLVRKTTIESPYFDDDKLFNDLDKLFNDLDGI